MSAAPAQAPKPKKRRISPIALAAAPVPAAAPAPAAAPVPAAAPGVPFEALDHFIHLETLDRYIQQSLQALRDDVAGMLSSAFVPDKGTLDALDAGVKRLRGCVDRYNAAAQASERAAADERARLEAELKPVRIKRTESTKAIYARRAAALSGETNRFLYRCPLADSETGVCHRGNASRPCQPSVRKDITAHIARWHMPDDHLREHRRSDEWWARGAAEARAKSRAKAKRRA